MSFWELPLKSCVVIRVLVEVPLELSPFPRAPWAARGRCRSSCATAVHWALQCASRPHARFSLAQRSGASSAIELFFLSTVLIFSCCCPLCYATTKAPLCWTQPRLATLCRSSIDFSRLGIPRREGTERCEARSFVKELPVSTGRDGSHLISGRLIACRRYIRLRPKSTKRTQVRW